MVGVTLDMRGDDGDKDISHLHNCWMEPFTEIRKLKENEVWKWKIWFWKCGFYEISRWKSWDGDLAVEAWSLREIRNGYKARIGLNRTKRCFSTCPPCTNKYFPVIYFSAIVVLFLFDRSDWMPQEISLLACDWNGHHPGSALNIPWRSHISCEEPSPGLVRDIANNLPYCSDALDGPGTVSVVLSHLFPPTW